MHEKIDPNSQSTNQQINSFTYLIQSVRHIIIHSVNSLLIRPDRYSFIRSFIHSFEFPL